MSKRLSKIVLVLLILSGATAVWIPRQRSLAEARATLAETKVRQIKAKEHINTANTELESARSELHAENASRKQIRAAIEKAEAELMKVDPESRWATPPHTLPDWNSESPYVWLRKDILAELPVHAFTEKGTLNDDVAAALTLNETQKAEMNTTLARTMSEYQALETANAETSDEHLPGILEEKGEKLTIVVQPQPDDGQRLRQQFEAALRNELGSQRTDFLLQNSSSWVDQQFSQFGAKPKTISLLRHLDGSYSLSMKSGTAGWFSADGPWKVIKLYIPAHLRNFFSDMAPPQPEQISQ